MSPYEWYFYSSGAREEGWTRHDQVVNRVTAIGGFALGSLLSDRAARLALRRSSCRPGSTPTTSSQTGLLGRRQLRLVGHRHLPRRRLRVRAGRLDRDIGVERPDGRPSSSAGAGAPRARRATCPGSRSSTSSSSSSRSLILLAGFDPIKVTIVALVFSVGALPFTFLPMLVVANDPYSMGDDTNGRLANALGCFFLAPALAWPASPRFR